MKQWWFIPATVLVAGAALLLYIWSLGSGKLPSPKPPVPKKPGVARVPAPVPEEIFVDRILVEKHARKMTLFRKGKAVKRYGIALGFRPSGRKTAEGDGRPPEGCYIIDHRNSTSRFHRALHISYPSQGDKVRAAALGLAPGGDIMIHGLKKEAAWLGRNHRARDWTNGCVAVTNDEIEEIWRLVPDGTVVEIVP
jgi:murein L,D-transpeptidase YafK